MFAWSATCRTNNCCTDNLPVRLHHERKIPTWPRDVDLYFKGEIPLAETVRSPLGILAANWDWVVGASEHLVPPGTMPVRRVSSPKTAPDFVRTNYIAVNRHAGRDIYCPHAGLYRTHMSRTPFTFVAKSPFVREFWFQSGNGNFSSTFLRELHNNSSDADTPSWQV
jgi:hypothetical protein